VPAARPRISIGRSDPVNQIVVKPATFAADGLPLYNTAIELRRHGIPQDSADGGARKLSIPWGAGRRGGAAEHAVGAPLDLSRAGLVSSERHSRSIVYRADLAEFQKVAVYLLRRALCCTCIWLSISLLRDRAICRC
jgi:hypothetical protein